MKVLVTGGAGFLGSHLCDAHLARGDEVYSLDTGSDFKVRHILNNPKFKMVSASVLDHHILEGLILKCDLIYHFAAVVGVEHYVEDPYKVLDVNINGTQLVLKLAFKHNKRVVFSSTSEVYGRNPKVPFAESDDRVLGSTKIDRWCYSTSKAAGEHFCFAYWKMGLPVTVVRYFNAYGPRLDKLDVGRIITIFLGQALRGEPLTVIGDGKQTRCFTYIDDAMKATIAAGTQENTLGDIFNIGTDVETPIIDLAEMIIELTGGKSKIKFVPQEQIYGNSYEDISRRVPEVSKMRKVLGIKAETPLKEGLKTTIDWFKGQL